MSVALLGRWGRDTIATKRIAAAGALLLAVPVAFGVLCTARVSSAEGVAGGEPIAPNARASTEILANPTRRKCADWGATGTICREVYFQGRVTVAVVVEAATCVGDRIGVGLAWFGVGVAVTAVARPVGVARRNCGAALLNEGVASVGIAIAIHVEGATCSGQTLTARRASLAVV